jgi:hypothetical protein
VFEALAFSGIVFMIAGLPDVTEELSDLSPPSRFQFFHGFTDPPGQDGNCEPCQSRDGKDGRTGVTGQEAPNQYCECN